MHELLDEHILERILAGNDELAHHNRDHFDTRAVLAINFMSAPGAGKTSLLAASIPRLRDSSCCVIEGDMFGQLDADRLRKDGTKVFQISTGRSCHLDAQMVSRLLHEEKLEASGYLFIENVGNLVCPAEFDLGEHKRVVLLSVTEGDDKPTKYPVIFRQCDAVVFTKVDLLAHVEFEISSAIARVKDINPDVEVFALSAVSGEGMAEWMSWLDARLEEYLQQLEGAKAHVPVGSG